MESMEVEVLQTVEQEFVIGRHCRPLSRSL